jgi:hypothetical protein
MRVLANDPQAYENLSLSENGTIPVLTMAKHRDRPWRHLPGGIPKA